MTLLKSIYFLLVFFIAGIIISPGQSSVNITVQWTGVATVQIPNGSYITLPSAKNAFVNSSGTLIYQLDIPGKVTSIAETNIEFKSSDSLTTAVLSKLTVAQGTSISSAYMYNDVVSTRIYIPLLRINGNGALARISSFSLSYSVIYINTNASVQPKTSLSNARTTSTGNSVLSQGSWYKMGVSQSGIYRIDAAYLNSMGINAGSLNPNTVQIFGNGGGMLPQPNDSSRINDLAEVATYLYEDGNGIFDGNDYMLFYAESPNIWQYNSDSAAIHPFSHQVDVYSTQNFYFLTFGQNNGKHITTQAAVTGATQNISTYNEHLYLEPDLYNIISSGRQWYGDQFDQFTPSRSYSFNISGATSTGTLSISTLARSNIQSSFQYNFNNNTVVNATAAALNSTNENSPSGTLVYNNYTFNAAGNSTLNVTITYSNGGSISALGNLNYIEVNFLRSLQLYGNQTIFQSFSSLQSTSQFNIGNCNGSEMVWDITDPTNIAAQTTSFSGSSMSFTASSTSVLREYIVLQGTSFPNPSFTEVVANQNLHGLTTPDMVIVTYPAFLIQAQRLQAFREANDGLNVEVVTTEQVFNEFSSGKQDVTAIRDFVRMLYNNPSTTTLKYLLLFGNGSYDYRNIQNLNSNYVPTYESIESLNPLQSYNSDDYFTFMDPQEGAWTEGSYTTDVSTMNFGVGRLNARSSIQADEIVSKIMSYSVNSSSNMGNWRNKLTLSACDGDANLHLNNAEIEYKQIDTADVQLNVNKIYIDAYPQESSPAGKIAPLVIEAINQDMDEGMLIWNYVGHGGVGGLAQQGIVTDASISSWTNYNRLPFMVTATCDFGRYDTPGLVSGAETALLSTTGGSCGMLTSTRTVFSNSNTAINSAFYTYVFTRNTTGTYPAIGNVMMNTKNTSISGVYNRNYSLLSDPSMILSFPKEKMVITAINNVPVSSVPDTLKALSQITLNGIITDFNGNLLNNFNGQANIIVYDKPSIITTLGSAGSIVTTFKLQNNFIFNGLASVTNGAFKVSFIVPKDISYNYAFGKISLYSQPSMGNLDAGGYFSNIVVGGTNPHAPIDVTPPTVKLYLNDPSFVSGGVAGTNPIFFAQVSDASGINVSTAGIGHQITLTMSNSSEVIVLNQYYTAALNDYTKGTVQYPFTNLAPGTYTLHFTVWDTYNNSAQESLEFTILNTANIQLDHVLNYPNPFTTNTNFHFDHNRFGDDLQVQVQVYTVSGILIKSMEENFYNSPSHISGISWNGLDEFGSKIGHGVYVYKLKIRSLTDGSTAHVYQKLVLL